MVAVCINFLLFGSYLKPVELHYSAGFSCLIEIIVIRFVTESPGVIYLIYIKGRSRSFNQSKFL
ncbi:hypothetical protein AFI02nite_08480 [Aliivibrio fischeri]|uniref:Uncharacterized protein n=1 Tax=Aliivibrio fischeri TaxID=668 RepID=A0A510UDX3_ALIFS|nr:hypothetical protein AFI02nite_08480 [Aliivibrio fischeri]